MNVCGQRRHAVVAPHRRVRRIGVFAARLKRALPDGIVAVFAYDKPLRGNGETPKSQTVGAFLFCTNILD